jgi:phenylacetate-CoA ligase
MPASGSTAAAARRPLEQLAALIASARRSRWASSRLCEQQDRGVRHLVRHASDSSPFYRDLLDRAKVSPDEIQGAADLPRLPLMRKEDLPLETAPPGREPAARRNQTVIVRTSGSSGTPLAVRYTRRDATELNVSWLRPLFAHGIRPWHRRFEITGPHNFPGPLSGHERFGLWRRRCVSVFDEPREWLAAARTTPGDYLWGYSGSLKLFARYLLDGGHEAPPFRAVFGVSDLVDPRCRDAVRQAFGTPLVDVYGAAEAGCIAWECATCDGYHVNTDTVVVEVLDGDRPAPPGVAGRVVVTNLLSFAMPIIRYELGDVAVMSKRTARCGRGLPLMDVVEGRANAFVRLPSGRLLSPMFFFGVMKPFESGLRAWRVIQESAERLSVLVVAAPAGAETATLAETIRRLAGEPVHVSVVAVDALPPETSGKTRAVFSRLTATAP